MEELGECLEKGSRNGRNGDAGRREAQGSNVGGASALERMAGRGRNWGADHLWLSRKQVVPRKRP